MSIKIGGPMFEPASTALWEASACFRCRERKGGAHYNIYGSRDAQGMLGLRTMFPDAKANDMNFVLFSTSGVHGTYGTIEDAESDLARGGKDEDGEETTPAVTFLIVHPRIVCLRYGNCEPRTADDIAYLKALRASSWEAASTIGREA